MRNLAYCIMPLVLTVSGCASVLGLPDEYTDDESDSSMTQDSGSPDSSDAADSVTKDDSPADSSDSADVQTDSSIDTKDSSADALPDSTADSSQDSVSDTTAETSVESGADTAKDTSVDTALDTSVDTALDTSIVDSSTDPKTDTSAVDTGLDSSLDTQTDVVDGGAGPTILGLAAGGNHACAMVSEQSKSHVYCWGNCEKGQSGACSGVITTPKLVKDDQASPLEKVIGLSAGDETSCALLDDGSVWCWGACSYGAVGDPSCTSGVTVYPRRVRKDDNTELAGMKLLSGGGNYHCAAGNDNQLMCWGESPVDATKAFGAKPVSSPITNLSAIAVAGEHACVQSGTSVACWGKNSIGQASGKTADGNVLSQPITVNLSSMAVQMSVGYEHSCAVNAQNKILCWGAWNETFSPSPSLVTIGGNALDRMVRVSGAVRYSCGLDQDGAAWCWGINPKLWASEGQTGTSAEPQMIHLEGGTSLNGMKYLDGGGLFSCGATSSDIYCWGDLGYLTPVYQCDQADGGTTANCSPYARKIPKFGTP